MGTYGKGISFPFRFTPTGSIAISDSSPQKEYRKIKESISQILLTEPGERVMESEFGCPLRDIMFEPLDVTLNNLIAFRVTNAIERWESRVKINSIAVSKGDKNSIRININFSVVVNGDSATLSIDRSV